MREYDIIACTDMKKSIKTTQEVPGSTVIAFETLLPRRALQPSRFIKVFLGNMDVGPKPPT